MPMISKEDVAQLLGRPLSAKETAAYDTYVEIAQAQLERILGFSLALNGNIETVKSFRGRGGYTSIFTPPFSNVTSVKVDGVTAEYRIGESKQPLGTEVIVNCELRSDAVIEITAKWGYSDLPGGVKLLLATMFDIVANNQTTVGVQKVKSETTLSHSVSYDNSKEAIDSFAAANQSLIDLYRAPQASNIQAGCIAWGDDE